jgi:hypothetical protein
MDKERVLERINSPHKKGPSKLLLNLDKKYFYKQFEIVRKAQRQDISNIKKQTEEAAKSLFAKMMEGSLKCLRKEMVSMILRFDEVSLKFTKLYYENKSYQKYLLQQELEITKLSELNKFAIYNFSGTEMNIEQKGGITELIKSLDDYVFGSDRNEKDVSKSNIILQKMDEIMKVEEAEANRRRLRYQQPPSDPLGFYGNDINAAEKDKGNTVAHDTDQYFK